MSLKAPESYWELSEEEKNKMLNKCGPDGPLNQAIPNHLSGLDISESCDIHDYMFIRAKNQTEYKEADKVFLHNMMTQIETKPAPTSIWRKMLAYMYFGAVRVYSWFQ